MQRLIHKWIARGFEDGVKRRGTFRCWDSLERTQWNSRGELEQIQLAALRRLLAHASARCPYYRETWREAGLRPDAVQSLHDYSAWPILMRDTIREHRSAMRSEAATRLIAKTTGGSSGVPLTFDLDEGSYARRMAATFRGYGWADAGPGAKTWLLWGGAVGARRASAAIKERAYERLYRRHTVNCFSVSDNLMPAIVADLNLYRPDVIVAYTNPLYSLARHVSASGRPVHRPRSIVVGAEKLHDFQRAAIETAFAAPVFETYGSREFMLIASECEQHGGLHVTMEHLIVEIVDDDGKPVPDGTEGNVVITDLYNYGMPFVRYANGDRAVAARRACGCGRGLKTLERISGRRLDMLRMADGRTLAGEFFPHLIKDFDAVHHFQVEQASLDRIRIRVVLTPAYASDAGAQLATLKRLICDQVGPAVAVVIETVPEIPLTAAGKLQVVVNRTAAA